MPKATPRAPAEQVALYDKLVATDSRAERKGATMPYTSVNGNMFSLLGPEGLILRLSPADREAFVAKHKTKPVVMYGAEMREYVAVPATLLAKTSQLAKLFAASYDYAASLRPKPTKKAASKRSTR